MMSSLANTILFLALVTTSIMVAVMYVKLRKLDRYHAEYQQIFDKTGTALTAAQKAVVELRHRGEGNSRGVGAAHRGGPGHHAAA